MPFLLFLVGPIGRYLVAAAVIGGALWWGYAHVKGIGWDERDLQAQEEKKAMEAQIQALTLKRGEVTEKVVVRWRDRERIVKQQGEEVIRYVEKLVPADSCQLHPGFRVLHDAATDGAFSEPPERAIARAAPVDQAAAAETVATNYLSCRSNTEQLLALQSWIKQQAEVK